MPIAKHVRAKSRQAFDRVREVGIAWSDDGDSRLELVRGNMRNFADILRIRFARYELPRAGAELPLAQTVAGTPTEGR